MNRRGIVAAGGVAALAACAPLAANVTQEIGQVAIYEAQNYASVLVNALVASAQRYEANPTAPGSIKDLIEKGIVESDAALVKFRGIAEDHPAAVILAQELLTAAHYLLPFLVLDPPVQIAVSLALAVLGAFVNSLKITVPPIPASLHRMALTRRY